MSIGSVRHAGDIKADKPTIDYESIPKQSGNLHCSCLLANILIQKSKGIDHCIHIEPNGEYPCPPFTCDLMLSKKRYQVFAHLLSCCIYA